MLSHPRVGAAKEEEGKSAGKLCPVKNNILYETEVVENARSKCRRQGRSKEE